MPSTVTVPVARIDKILPHGNADKLEIAHVLGWQTLVPKGMYQEGDVVVYFAPDLVLSEKLSDKLGVTQYLKNGRISAVKLRGEKSFGLVAQPDDPTWPVGTNVAEHYEVEKYVPKNAKRAGLPESRANKRLAELEGFPKYTSIENARYYPDLLDPDETVVVTEKIHGTNSRVGLLRGQWVAGSHNVRRAKPFGFLAGGEKDAVWKKLARWLAVKWNWLHGKLVGAIPFRRIRRLFRWRPLSTDTNDLYWSPLKESGIANLLRKLGRNHERVALYGEIYGPGIQKLGYDVPDGETRYAAFDLKVDGKYVDWNEFHNLCSSHGVPMVPLLYRGPRSGVNFATMSEGCSMLAAHMREGVVVKPLIERNNPKIGRVILKYVSDTYLLSKTDDVTVDG